MTVLHALDPVMDEARLAEIAELDLLGPVADDILREEARAAAEQFGLPIALVSIMLDHAQQFAAQVGLGGWLEKANGTPVEWSFCAHAVRSGDAFVVEDAATHPLVADNPLVLEDGIRCYAGIPLISSRGHALGSFCVIGTEARGFSEDEIADLRVRAARVVERLEARRPSAA